MKKLFGTKFLVFMMLMLMLVLAACGDAEETEGTGNTDTPETETDTETETDNSSEGEASGDEGASEKLVIGFSQVGAESEWRTANTESMKAAITDAGHELKFSDGQQKQENQIKAIRTFITQKVDAIVFSPVVETGFETVLQEAKDAGIPVFLADRSVDIEDDSLWATFLGSDFVEEGRKAGNWLVEEMADEEGPVNIVELQGTVGSAPANDRKEGFEEIIGDHDKFEIIKSQTGEFTRAKGKEVMEAFLKSDGENIDVLYAHNDDMAIGAIQAIEEYGLKPGEDIIVIGVDAVKGAFEAMAAGKMNVTIECNPLFGPQMVELIEKHVIDGEELEKRIAVEESMYTMDQAEELLPTRKY
ncbi:ABC transporter substrate-binding protein [Aquibacillus koreensis]|uniref:ABC transporter substrate-binding protein n=1 Tax=Aquibacillus koreensis TaxID=279446 RepID=A0A9X3WMX6_9BACI|nr:ABC transporter substrate-binding protein [Aquibacillus koreensis]MCT2537215.1 ABC transporter substrate-binding protein [Aquibacillus koreensis]MDC3421563.1 ABC transporter substrate-binding protein [Aquibacillus koreensis]